MMMGQVSQFISASEDPFLLRVHAVNGLDGEAVADLLRLCGPERRVDARRDLTREGKASGRVIVLKEGWACRYKLMADGSRHILAFLLPGDICNPEALAWDHPSYSVAALTPCLVVEIDAERLRGVVRTDPAFAAAWLTLGLIDNAMLAERNASLSRRPAQENLAHLFCELFVRLSAVGLTNEMSFGLPITQDAIGDATGLTSVHVNRMLRRLRDDGLVFIDHRRLVILDWYQLSRTATFDERYLRLSKQDRRSAKHGRDVVPGLMSMMPAQQLSAKQDGRLA